jgi:hypothetical protein
MIFNARRSSVRDRYRTRTMFGQPSSAKPVLWELDPIMASGTGYSFAVPVTLIGPNGDGQTVLP